MQVELSGLELIPEHCRGSVHDYIVNGTPPGRFLTYVFSNDFVHAFAKADEINLARMQDYARFLYNHAPFDCWGSPEKVMAWIDRKGFSRVATVAR